MCFSATASFVAGAALTATGVVTISKTKKRRALPFASIPLFFGIQQLLDGIAWISAGSATQAFAAYGYAFFAYVFWPIFIPFAVLSLEPKPGRKKTLRLLLIVGTLTSLYAVVLLLSGPVTARTINYCIRYDTSIPYWPPMLVPYLIATCGSCLLSSHKLLWIFGIVTLISVAIAGWFYFETFSSVWCFFAAILSFMVYWFVANTPVVKH
jgi:hypothetical protein